MRKLWLFERKWKIWGFILLIPCLILGILSFHLEFEIPLLEVAIPFSSDPFAGNQNFTDELAALGMIVGLMLIGFSKVKEEDEMIFEIRAKSLQISLLMNYLLVMLTILIVYDSGFLVVMVYNIFTPLLVYTITFHIKLRTVRLAYRKDHEE